MTREDFDLGQITDLLERYGQRATYGAVAGLLGSPARSLMLGQDKNFRNSWIVSSRTKQPTGYTPDQIHPRLEDRTSVLSTSVELAAWIKDRT